MIMSLFFSMAEVVRYLSLEKEAISVGYSAAQSAFGEYNRPLWEDYGILAIDTDYGLNAGSMYLLEDTVSNYIEKDFVLEDGGVDLLKLQVSEVATQDSVFLTDYDGAAFIKEAAKSVEGELTEDALQALLGGCNECEEASEEDIDVSDVLSNTQDFLNRTEKTDKEETVSVEQKPDNGEAKDQSGSIIAQIKELESKGVLSQVTEDYDAVSGLAFSTDECVSNRELRSGDGTVEHVTLPERGLFQYYLTKNFSCYGEKAHDRGMAYELEYILCGKPSDKENLTKTVERILAIREAENIISLSSDKNKMAEIKSMATAASAVILHPELEEVVSYGIMAAWAYLESVLDVRLLLTGGKVSFVKSPQEWTSELSQIETYMDVSVKAKNCDSGISYKGYLFALFTLESQRKIAYRGLDLIEEALHQNSDYAYAKADHFLVESCVVTTFGASPLFLSFIPLYPNHYWEYRFVSKRKITYL